MLQNAYSQAHRLMHYFIIYVLLYPFYFLLFRPQITGRENIPKTGQFLIAANHYSYYDPTIISLSFAQPIAYLAKQELFDNSVLGQIIRSLGAIPINRNKPAPSSLKQIKQVLSSAWPIAIFIEGTRNQSQTHLGNLETGTAFIAKLGKGLPVVPIGIRQSKNLFGSLQVKIGEPIFFQGNLSLEEQTLIYGQAIAKLAKLELNC